MMCTGVIRGEWISGTHLPLTCVLVMLSCGCAGGAVRDAGEEIGMTIGFTVAEAVLGGGGQRITQIAKTSLILSLTPPSPRQLIVVMMLIVVMTCPFIEIVSLCGMPTGEKNHQFCPTPRTMQHLGLLTERRSLRTELVLPLRHRYGC